MFNNFLNTVSNAAKSVGQAVEESNRNNHQNNQNDEETIGKVDSQGGKVQVTTVQDDQQKKAEQTAKGADFLNGLLNVAQQVGKSLEEHQKQTANKGAEEETVGKVDSQGGKVQVNTVQDDQQKKAEQTSKGAEFLDGLMNVAQAVGKSLEDHQKQQKQGEKVVEKQDANEVQGGVASKTSGGNDSGFLSGLANVATDIGNAIEKSKKEEEERKKKEQQEKDMKALGDNISNLVGGFFKKDDKKKDEPDFKKEAVIDDIEGEIGKSYSEQELIYREPPAGSPFNVIRSSLARSRPRDSQGRFLPTPGKKTTRRSSSRRSTRSASLHTARSASRSRSRSRSGSRSRSSSRRSRRSVSRRSRSRSQRRSRHSASASKRAARTGSRRSVSRSGRSTSRRRSDSRRSSSSRSSSRSGSSRRQVKKAKRGPGRPRTRKASTAKARSRSRSSRRAPARSYTAKSRVAPSKPATRSRKR